MDVRGLEEERNFQRSVAKKVAGYVDGQIKRAEKAEQELERVRKQLSQVREEVKKIRHDGELGEEVVPVLAGVRLHIADRLQAILDSSSSLSGDGKCSGVGDFPDEVWIGQERVGGRVSERYLLHPETVEERRADDFTETCRYVRSHDAGRVLWSAPLAEGAGALTRLAPSLSGDVKERGDGEMPRCPSRDASGIFQCEHAEGHPAPHVCVTPRRTIRWANLDAVCAFKDAEFLRDLASRLSLEDRGGVGEVMGKLQAGYSLCHPEDDCAGLRAWLKAAGELEELRERLLRDEVVVAAAKQNYEANRLASTGDRRNPEWDNTFPHMQQVAVETARTLIGAALAATNHKPQDEEGR